MMAEFCRRFGARLFFAMREPLHLAGMWREQPFTLATLERGDFFSQNIQAVSVNHHWLLRLFDQFQNFGSARFSKTRSHRPDISFFLEQIAVRFEWLNH